MGSIQSAQCVGSPDYCDVLKMSAFRHLWPSDTFSRKQSNSPWHLTLVLHVCNKWHVQFSQAWSTQHTASHLITWTHLHMETAHTTVKSIITRPLQRHLGGALVTTAWLDWISMGTKAQLKSGKCSFCSDSPNYWRPSKRIMLACGVRNGTINH